MQKKVVISLEKLLLRRDTVLIKTMNELGRERIIDFSEQAWEYVRLSSLELVAHEIDSKNIKGSVAELGVYRGDFAKMINEAFPNRKLYLFDTFEGFVESDIKADLANNYASEIQNFANTNHNLVLGKMKYANNCEIIQGHFPDSANQIDDQFVFVSIDADLYEPIYNGLNYFYPRLVKGGYLFVHDYNNSLYQGAKAAVQKYCDDNEITYFPLSDAYGTAVILK